MMNPLASPTNSAPVPFGSTYVQTPVVKDAGPVEILRRLGYNLLYFVVTEQENMRTVHFLALDTPIGKKIFARFDSSVTTIDLERQFERVTQIAESVMVDHTVKVGLRESLQLSADGVAIFCKDEICVMEKRPSGSTISQTEVSFKLGRVMEEQLAAMPVFPLAEILVNSPGFLHRVQKICDQLETEILALELMRFKIHYDRLRKLTDVTGTVTRTLMNRANAINREKKTLLADLGTDLQSQQRMRFLNESSMNISVGITRIDQCIEKLAEAESSLSEILAVISDTTSLHSQVPSRLP